MARKHPEDDLQRAVCDLLAVYERQGLLMSFAVPNGGKRNAREAARMKMMGVRPGVPDLCLLFPGGRTIFLELKAPKGKLSPHQADWIKATNAMGYTTLIVRDVHMVVGLVKIITGGKHEAATAGLDATAD